MLPPISLSNVTIILEDARFFPFSLKRPPSAKRYQKRHVTILVQPFTSNLRGNQYSMGRHNSTQVDEEKKVLNPCRNRNESRLVSPLPSTVRALPFYRETILALFSSSTRIDLCLPTLASHSVINWSSRVSSTLRINSWCSRLTSRPSGRK